MKKSNVNKLLKIICTIILLIIIFNALCITPKGALRTHLFMDGHPIIAVITPIRNDELHNKLDGNLENAHYYTLTICPREKSTGGYLNNYMVKKKGFFYLAEYYGEL